MERHHGRAAEARRDNAVEVEEFLARMQRLAQELRIEAMARKAAQRKAKQEFPAYKPIRGFQPQEAA